MQTGLEDQLGLYQKRIPIFTRSVKGKFRRFKTSVLVLAYAIYFLLPWLPWSRLDAPAQAVLFDLPGRRFLIFGLTVYPQDVIWLALLLFIAAILLFFVTGLVGRAFCGYFCFQTLWTDFFIWIEYKVQGERPARVRLYRQPWDREKVLKVGGTHALWMLASLWTGLTFVFYFAYAPQLLLDFFTGQAAPAAYITVGILTLSTYVAAGLMREQICTYVCPYGRFQSVMYEPETLAVHYDVRRGEAAHGRAAARAGQRTLAERREKGLGDCVDCGLCVQVCPVGIDIRDGLQYKCISCGLCIDACNTIMDSFNFPRGLIRYDSEKNLASPTPAAPTLKWKRLKTIGYGMALVLMSAYLVYSVATRGNFNHTVNQIRQPLYVMLSNGDIRNRYQIRITNKAAQAQTYDISARGIPAEALDLGNFSEITIKPGHSALVQASVRLPLAVAAPTQRFELVITPQGKPAEATAEYVRFDAPGKRP
ncbi:MAG TPA: cytochrome c oxidase accessory protein CcoG [Thiobacillus sp.]|nr:MAG: cytochrome c oxidase accessory protein CcoG [Hydrogenophilales bacterium 16-64-40]OZA35451.1 MAG: cytochrome c oxidase accessory protein CcoG [Hydrogenophilales bacterium 17-64-65]HQS82772.1 cytochrome c oxidase accessory protein CcoG [Thiobacillus sp.]HQT35306.1 cytochrome c oxidase accessory protein CcoG [Thiobacillus sp.]